MSLRHRRPAINHQGHCVCQYVTHNGSVLNKLQITTFWNPLQTDEMLLYKFQDEISKVGIWNHFNKTHDTKRRLLYNIIKLI